MSLQLIPPLHRATHRVGLCLQAVLGATSSQGEAHILAYLHGHPTASTAELHRDLAHRRSTLTSILDRLAERGLVARDVHPDDRRSFQVTLTPRGKTEAKRVHTCLAALESAVAGSASPAELRGFTAVVAAIAEAAHTLQTRSKK